MIDFIWNRCKFQTITQCQIRYVVCVSSGTSVHSFKFAADFDSPLEHLLAMSREFDLTYIWNRYVLDSIILAEPSIFESTLYAASWLPFPFPHIDVVVQARGIDLADVSTPAASQFLSTYTCFL